jgi:hypothetical protein
VHWATSSERSSNAAAPRSTPIATDAAGGGGNGGSGYWSQARKDPLSVPYTTSASQFLYGASVVMAALRWARRKLYKLYIAKQEHVHAPTPSTKTQQQDHSLARRTWVVERARDIGVPIVALDRDGQRLLDKLSNGRPHNVSKKPKKKFF